MKVMRAGAFVVTFLVGASLAGCQNGSSGLVSKAENQAQQDRLDDYTLYAKQGKSAKWVDQWVCVTNTGAAVVNVALVMAYGFVQQNTVPQMQSDATAVGDTKLGIALNTALTTGLNLYNDPTVTVRQAIEDAIGWCAADVLTDDEKTQAIDAQIQMAEQASQGYTATYGGPTWTAPDGARVSGAANVSTPQPTTHATGITPSPNATAKTPTAEPTGTPPPGECTADTIAEVLIAFVKGQVSRATALAAAGPESQRDMSDWLDTMEDGVHSDPYYAAHPEALLGGGTALASLCS